LRFKVAERSFDLIGHWRYFRCAISDPNNATPSTLPVWRAELNTLAATPERDFSTLPRSADASGGTGTAMPSRRQLLH